MSKNTVRLCDDCNSVVITVKRGNNYSVECSYCGESYDTGFETKDLELNHNGEDNEV